MTTLFINLPATFIFRLSFCAVAALFAVYFVLRKRPVAARIRILLALSLSLLLLIFAFGSARKTRAAVASHSAFAAPDSEPGGKIVAVSATSPTVFRSDLDAPRPVYGHSIVKGGIHSLGELLDVIATDPLAAQHYKGFDITKAHFIRLDHNIVAYISYRVDGKGIYWSSKPELILAGEQVITDGTNFIRVRCGNMISYAPQSPAETDEPTDTDTIIGAFVPAFDPAPTTAANLPQLNTPPADSPQGTPSAACCSGGGIGTPPIFFVGSSAPQTPSTPGVPPVVSVDEFPAHGEFFSLLAAVIALFLIRKRIPQFAARRRR